MSKFVSGFLQTFTSKARPGLDKAILCVYQNSILMKATLLSISACITTMIVLMTACHQNNPWVQEGDDLVRQAVLLDAQHVQLNTRIDSLWDATSAALDKGL